MSDKIIDLFINQVKKACAETGEPLPNIVKNYKKGDTKLYKTRYVNEWLRDHEKFTPGDTLTADEYGFSKLKETMDALDFDEINNNTDERE